MGDAAGSGPGGVKAMLSRIKEQYQDSHVQLPDGSVPKGKVNITAKPKDSLHQSKAQSSVSSSGSTTNGSALGVKAKLAEINSKFTNSFVKLPDGSVPGSVATPKKTYKVDSKKAEASENIEPESWITDDIPTTPLKDQGGQVSDVAYSDYPPSRESRRGRDKQSKVVSDYEVIQASSFSELVVSTNRGDRDDSSAQSSRSTSSHVSSYTPTRISNIDLSFSTLNPPPQLLERNRFQGPGTQVEEPGPFRPHNMPTRPSAPEFHNAEPRLFASSSSASSTPQLSVASITPTYGIGVVKLAPGGPGAQSKRVFVGDKLVKINDIDMAQVALDQFPELISGPNGSNVKLSLLRQREDDSRVLVHVNLVRGPCDSQASASSGPRVLVPKVIAVNPVPVVNSEPARTSLGAGSQITDRQATAALPGHGSLFTEPRAALEARPDAIPPAMQRNGSPLMHQSGSAFSRPGDSAGIGVVLADESGSLKISRMVPGGPALMSGAILPGDMLVEVNGRDVTRFSLQDAQAELSGPPSSSVVIGVRRRRAAGHPDTLHRVQLHRSPPDAGGAPRPAESPVRPQAGAGPAREDAGDRPSKLLEMLFLGDDATSRNHEALRREGISCVINAAREVPCLFEREFAYTHLHLDDSPAENVRKGFDQVNSIVSRNMAKGLSTLVHCSAGLSRSAALCIAFLMREKRATLRQAFHLVRRERPAMRLSHAFFLQLVGYEREVFGFNSMQPCTQEEYAQILHAPA